MRDEVQRLAGEVEVLRGVVEEGLKERRASKESIQIEEEDAPDEEIQENDESRQDDDDAGIAQDEDDEAEELERNLEISDSPGNVADKTIRTDRATLGESANSKGLSVQFVDEEELDKIEEEIEERRSNVSISSVSSEMVRSPSPVKRPSNHNNRATMETAVDANRRQHSFLPQAEPSNSRPPVSAHAAETRGTDPVDTHPETPFPTIRGEHLERLFFSVPEHNAKTCAVCYRRRDRTHGGLPASTRRASATLHEEAMREKNGGHEALVDEQLAGDWRRKGKQRDREAFSEDPGRAVKNKGLPPQTVVARVIRELEDDFAHYKRLVHGGKHSG